MMKSPEADVKTFITWWALVQENASLLPKAKQKLGSWRLQDEHFQVGVWEAVAGLALHTSPGTAHIKLSADQPWELPGLQPVLNTLQKVNCQCVAEWRREWSLGAHLVTPCMAALLQCSSPTTVTVSLREHQHSASFPALPAIMSRLARTSCSLSLSLEGDFRDRSDFLTSDHLLLHCLQPQARVRLRRLSCHMGVEAADHFFQDEPQNDSSDEDFPGVRHRPMYLAIPAIRYLQVLKVRISSLEVIIALNRTLPYLELLEDLEIHLTFHGIVFSDDVPQLTYNKDNLMLRIDDLTDARAEWAGRVTGALSRQYSQVWLSWCRMTAIGGSVFLDQLRYSRTLIGAIHVFSLSGRPDWRQFSILTSQAAQLANHTALYW
ncbi:uncharacterized protein [Panulirus ornatus]|uniref:uncharacterized protein n=1 Tax=Panulirus ornatus TaxID=150431 RepID=UPI003A8AAF71